MDNDSGCPLTLKYIDAVSKLIDNASWLEAKRAHLYKVQDLARVVRSNRALLQLRAFYAVEVMATRGLTSYYHTAPVMPNIVQMRWPRSAAGLTELLKTVRAERYELTADTAEKNLTWRPPNETLLVLSQAEKKMRALTLVYECAYQLRHSLRASNNGWRSLRVIGEKLCEVCSNSWVDALIQIAHELLEQNEYTGRRVWDPKTP